MKIFLIRHGETVDNVAALYAGTRDSALTNHGFLQAGRLGAHFVSEGTRLTHIFASDLTRAAKTAEAIRHAQLGGSESSVVGPVTQLKCLREQDFGYFEGKPFYARAPDARASGKDVQREQLKDDETFQDIESKVSMATRIDEFLDDHFIPQLKSCMSTNKDAQIAVVSHGIILSVLWNCFLRRLPPQSITFGPGAARDGMTLEYLGGWSNTGYLELDLSSRSEDSGPADAEPLVDQIPRDWTVKIVQVNSTTHLKSLKRTRGGVGSSKYDEGQQKLDSFFKKPKT